MRWHMTVLVLLALAGPAGAADSDELLLPVPVLAGDKALDVEREGHSAPFVGDFDGDGKLALMDEAIDELLEEQEKDEKRERPPETKKGPVDRVGDPLPPGAVARLGTVRFRPGFWSKLGLAFLPDGKTIVSACEGNLIQFWEAKTGRLLRSISTDEFNIRCFALSRDGKRIAVAGFANSQNAAPSIGGIRVLDVETGKLLYIFPRESRDVDWPSLAFTPDGKHLISLGNSGVLRIEEIASGKELLQHTFPQDIENRLSLSPDGSTIALASGHKTPRIYLWKWESGEEPRQLKAPERAGIDLAFSPDGKMLAELNDEASTLRLWDVASGNNLHKLQTPGDEHYASRHLAFAPDGKTLASSGHRGAWSGAIHLWDPITGRFKSKIDAREGDTGSLAFSPDSKLIAASTGYGIRVWEVATGKEIAANEEAHQGELTRVAFSSEGVVATASDDHTVRVWDATTGQQRLKLTHDHWVRGIAISPDSSRLVSSSLDNTVRMWDRKDGRQIFRLPGHGEQGGRRALGFTADGKRFLSFGDDYYLRVFDARTGKALHEHKIRPTGVRVPEEGADKANRIKDFFDLAEGAISADGKVFVVLTGGKASVFEVESGKEVRQFNTELRNSEKIAVSPDGKLLLASGWGKSIQIPLPDGGMRLTLAPEHPLELWDLATGKQVRQVMLHGSTSGPVAFTTDGKSYVAALQEKPVWKIRIWDTATGEEQPGIGGIPVGVSALAFSPDSKRLVSGLRDTTALVWDLTALPGRKP